MGAAFFAVGFCGAFLGGGGFAGVAACIGGSGTLGAPWALEGAATSSSAHALSKTRRIHQAIARCVLAVKFAAVKQPERTREQKCTFHPFLLNSTPPGAAGLGRNRRARS